MTREHSSQKDEEDMDEELILSGYADALGGDDEMGASTPLRLNANILRNPSTGAQRSASNAGARARGLASAVSQHVSALVSRQMTDERVEAIVKRMFDKVASQFPPGWLPAPDASTRKTIRLPLGFGYGDALTDTNTSVTLSVSPPRSLKGARVCIDRKNNGTNAPNTPIVVTSFSVGDLKQNVGFGGIPVEVFSPLAVNTALELDRIIANTPVEITLAVADGYLLSSTDQVGLGVTIIGELWDGR